MKPVLLCSLCFILVQISLGRELNKRQLDREFNLEYRTNRGVTYISQPSRVPASIPTSDTSGPPIRNGQNVNYGIFESPDEVAGGASGPVRVAPAPSQPADSKLPPKFGPVLFPDEEAAAQNNGTGQDGKRVQGGQSNQETKDPITVANPSQGQGNNRNNGKKNTGGSQQRESSSNRGNNSSNRNGSSNSNAPANNGNNGNNGNRNGNNGNGNGNGRGNGRKNCAFPVEMIFCILGR